MRTLPILPRSSPAIIPTSANHFHFVIWAAMDKVGTSFSDVTYIDVIGSSIAEAIEKAKAICPGKQHYWVNNIVEHHEHKHDGDH